MNSVISHTTPATSARPSLAAGLVTGVRPRQWPKNLLVFGAVAAAGRLLVPSAIADASLALIAFTLAASGTYLINDTIDAPADRLHPVKSRRPVAAGLISPGLAISTGSLLLVASVLPALLIGRAEFTATLLTYVGLTLSYTLWLKRVAVVDIVVVAAGFGLRAVGGAFAIAVPVSQWFLIVSFFGALFVVSGKRFAEQKSLGAEAARHRETLSAYAEFYAQHVMTLSSGITLVGYGLWAHDHGFLPEWWFLASLMLLVTILLRFALLVHSGVSDDPMEIAWKDRPLRVMAVLFIALVVAGIETG